MPAEPTKSKRRSSRRDFEYDTHARELELKRNRGEVSCAECRRLKIKCDKQIPCQSCQRRGCASLCPNGSLATGQGTRFVLAATEHLHRRIQKLSTRVRQLEDALATLQAQHSNEPHPLLHDDLLVKEERDEDGTTMVEDATGPHAQTEVIDAFGTLSISDHGISRFFGPTGGSESLLLANVDSSHAPPGSTCNPDSVCDSKNTGSLGELSLFSQSFPFTPMGQPADIHDLILSHLPPWERAISLCETYFEQVSWIFRGVTRLQLMDDMLPVIYRKCGPSPGEDYSSPHDLALLFMIFAIGALVQPEPSNAEGEHFQQIARAALVLQPVLEKPSIVTIQALHLTSIYNAMSGSDLKSETSMEITWSLITLACQLSQTIGLHRDSARWGLSPKMIQRRRILFWDLFVADVWQSLNTGRPPSFSLAYVDCSFPQYDRSEKGKGGFGSAFEIWQFRFAAECVAEVTSRTLTAEAPTYATIMELDRKVREFPLPEELSNAPANDLGASFQRCVLDHIKETVLMYIHRSFFAQAIIEHPVNPLKSAYAPSFLASYRAASTILKSVREQFSLFPISCSRFWTMWTFAFTAAVVFGTVVTRGPRSPLARSAMTELEQACVLFTKASKYSIRALKALPILTRLAEKAHSTLENVKMSSAGDHWSIQEDTDDELAIFAGHTRFVSARKMVEYTTSLSDEMIQEGRYGTSANAYAHTRTEPASIGLRAPPMAVLSPYSPETWQRYDNAQAQYTYITPERVTHESSPQKESSPQPRPYLWSNDANPIQLHLPTNQNPSQILASSEPEISMVPSTSSSNSDIAYAHLNDHNRDNQPANRVENHGLPRECIGEGEIALHVPYYSQNQPQRHYPHLYPPVLNCTPDEAVVSGTEPNMSPYSHHRVSSQPHHPQNPHHPHHGGTAQLADLGLASRDSRLDERWSSFMADSGLLEGISYKSQ